MAKLLTDNSPQFISKLVVAVCTTIGLKNTTTTEYYTETTEQAERLKRTIVAQLHHEVS